MTIRKHSSLAMAVITAAILTMQAMAQSAQPVVVVNQPAAKAAPRRVIVVSLEDRKLALVEDGQVRKIYTVAVGKPSTPSPVGSFTIERRVMNPTYSHDGRTVQAGPNNPVGTRWMGLSIKGYGIHGTNVPSSIGKAASHGCIRMARRDLEEFYPLVEIGDRVELIGERNEETAQLFGNETNPASAPAAAAQIASAPAPATVPALAELPATTRAAAGTIASAGPTGVAGSM